MSDTPLVSIVIPAYREEKNVLPMYEAVAAVIDGIKTPYEYEIVFVNDGSPDSTWQEIKKAMALDGRVRGVDLSRNFGKELAITAGLERAKGDAVITLDGDGQHPVEKIPEFLEKWEEGFDVVYNLRPEIRSASVLKRATSKAFYALFNSVSEFRLEPGATDYRLLDRAVVDAYLTFNEKNRMYRGLVDWLGFRKTALVFEAKERMSWDASYDYRKLARLAVNNLTSFSFFPLKFVGYMGFLIVSLWGMILVLQLLDKLGLAKFGFTNLGIVVVVNTIMIGVVLMSLGLIGLYIANIHEEVIGRPLYVVRSDRKKKR